MKIEITEQNLEEILKRGIKEYGNMGTTVWDCVKLIVDDLQDHIIKEPETIE